jgi:hypothetical protein
MQTNGEEIHADMEDARAASSPNVVRWVLIVSLLAAIVLLSAIWIIGAWSSDQNTQSVDARMRAAQAENAGSHTDSVVSDHADQMNATSPGQSTEPQNMPNKNAGQ